LEYQTLTIQVPKEAAEALDAVLALIEIIMEQSEGGFDYGDISPVMSKAIAAVSELSDFSEIMAEAQGDTEAMSKLIALFGAGVLGALGVF